MSTHGNLESGDLHWVLRQIAASEKRGLLSIQGEQDLVSMTFERGAIVAADAMNHPAEEMLGEVLANEGWLSPADFNQAIASGSSGQLASQVLAQSGAVEGRKLLRAVRLQTYRQAIRVLRWRSGNFDWTPDVEGSFHEGVEPLTMAELLLRASEELGSEGPLTGTVPELDTVFEHNPDRQIEIRKLEEHSQDAVPAAQKSDADVVWLTRQERKLCRTIDGRQPGSLLMLQSGLDPFQVKYALHYLSRCGLIRVSHQVSAENPLHSSLATGVRSTDILGSIESFEDSGAFGTGAPAAGSLGTGGRGAGSLPRVPGSGPLGSGAQVSGARRSEDQGSEDLGSSSLRFDEGLLSEPQSDRSARQPSAELSSPGSSAYPSGAREGSGEFRGGLVSASLEELMESETGARTIAPPRRQPWGEVAAPWLARGLALALVAVLVATTLLPKGRDSLLLPFPWLSEERHALDREQRLAIYSKIDRAIRTYHLLYGRYPEELSLLADLQLLAQPTDLHDSEGQWLAYSSRDGDYQLQPLNARAPADQSALASIQEDFLLNPRYVEIDTSSADRAVVLLD